MTKEENGELNLKLSKNSAENDFRQCFYQEWPVIEYNQNSFSEGSEKLIGVFNANPEHGKYFTFSEPEAHDQWNEHSDRLKEMFPEDGHTFIKNSKTNIKEKARDFQIRQS